MRIKGLCLFALGSLLAIGLAAPIRAERPPFKRYTTADGLAHDSVNKIVRDSRGFLWFCTAEGLSRFDGYRFKNYTQDQGLPHRNINDFLETREGDHLVATTAGLSVFNPLGRPYRWDIIQSNLEQTADDPPLFRTFFPPDRGVKQTKNILSLTQDRNGMIWAGTGDGLFQVKKVNDGWTFQEFNLDLSPGVSCPGFFADSEGGLFVQTSAGSFRISPGGAPTKLADFGSGSIFQDRDGHLWMDSMTGLRVFSFTDGKLKLLNTYSQKDGLPPNALHFSVIQTADGRIFVGFEYGFGEFLPNAKESEPKFRIFAIEKINSMAEDGGGNLWIGTDAKGAWKLARTGFTTFGEQDGVPQSDEIMSIFTDKQGEVYTVARPNKLSHLENGKFATVAPFSLSSRSWGWHFLDLITENGDWWVPAIDGLQHYPKVRTFTDLSHTRPIKIYTTADGLFSNEVFNLFEDSRGDIWITVIAEHTLIRWEHSSGKIFRYTDADGLPKSNGPLSFAEDAHGNIWFGYYFGGLARYRNGKFRFFNAQDGLPESRVNDLMIDSLGRLWIATSGRGLFRLDNTDDDRLVLKGFSTTNGLSSSQPLCLTEDRFGRIYVGTGRGINRIDRNDNVKVFTQEDGLPTNYITYGTVDKNGDLWFVGNNTVVRFVPEIEQMAAPPVVFIDRVLVNGVQQKISELGETEVRPLEFESVQRQFQVDFFALTFDAGNNIRYQYRLDQQDWSASIKQQTLNLDLAPGNHILLVRAIRSDGIVSEKPAIAVLRILQPLWLRWWFVSIAAVVIASIVYAFVRYRYQRMKALYDAREALRQSQEERFAELERVRKRIATDLHDDIGSSLTQISILSEVAQQRTDANNSQLAAPLSMIAGASRELVDAMSDIVWAINPQKDHLNDLTQRMRRFASDLLTARNIAFEFTEPDERDDVPLGANIRREVFLIFKESVNNLVRHAACTEVRIDFQIDAGALRLTVRDDGKGFDLLQQSEGHGLSSMRQRAEGLGGRFEMTSHFGKGTTIMFELPILRSV